MRKFWNSVYLNWPFFLILFIAAVFYVLGHYYPFYVWGGHLLLIATFLLIIFDLFLLYRNSSFEAHRTLNKIMSNGDENPYQLDIDNRYGFQVNAKIYDELPYQLGKRKKFYDIKINANKSLELTSTIKPVLRGTYQFGDIIAMVRSPIRLIQRKYVLESEEEIPVYPSYVHLNQYGLQNFKFYSNEQGSKRTRRLGHSLEFEQIKDYIKGDDIRHMNWKASAKRGALMVNQYIDERAQEIYCVIDSGRSMQMPFDGMSLLDYAINCSLALSHIIIKKHDRVGMIQFNKKVDLILPANKTVSQFPKILNMLYNLKTEFFESNFEKLYAEIKFKLNQRSLLILFTNFEEMDSLNRQLPYLKGLAKNNVLLVVFFKNKEIEELVYSESKVSNDYYQKAIAEKLMLQKKLMVRKLQSMGIQTLLTEPKNITVNTIDKYLQIKTMGLI